jgi:hypothetical protein
VRLSGSIASHSVAPFLVGGLPIAATETGDECMRESEFQAKQRMDCASFLIWTLLGSLNLRLHTARSAASDGGRGPPYPPAEIWPLLWTWRRSRSDGR